MGKVSGRPSNRVKPDWWKKLLQLPGDLLEAAAHKWMDWAGTWGERKHFQSMKVNEQELKWLKAEWKRLTAGAALGAGSGEGLGMLSGAERRIVEQIRGQTREANRNNVTRTAAYLRIYELHPELHWAFLAHMVSRNGGWSMTDLKGDLLPRLVSAGTRERLFSMLEDANAFIFGDAYPQLLLYEQSLQLGRPLFHLLPAFGVSAFMRPLWERFWTIRDPVQLTIGLIVNEQNFIEGRIVQDPEVAEQVLESLSFQMQSALQLNQIVFPYGGSALGFTGVSGASGRQRVAGLVLEDFGNLHERIEVGKKLYAMLFGIPDVAEGALRFARRSPHRGTRADYWPELFATVRLLPLQAEYKERLEGKALRPGAAPLYSPRLSDAWPDRPLREPARYDWFRDSSAASRYFTDVRPPFPYEMSAEHLFGLRKLELAAAAKAALH